MLVNNFGYLERTEGVRSGRPCIRDTGLLAEVIVGRFSAGESIADIAIDYHEPHRHIEACLRLVLYARGTNLEEKRAAAKVDAVIPLLKRRR